MSDTITLASPSTTADVVTAALANMGAQSGVVTDFNIGSQIRTTMESMGGVVDMQAVIAEALAFQAIVYSCWQAFEIVPLLATVATGSVEFLTGLGMSPPPASQAVFIPAGTVVQAGTVQFATTAGVLLAAGATSCTVTVAALVAGASGNVSAGAINVVSSGLGYPLYVTNPALFANATDAETPSATMLRFTAKILSLGLASPIAIANAVIGVSVAGTGETVAVSTVYEPWVNESIGSQVAGFTVCIDNGSGGASSGLIAAVTALLNGSRAILNALGYRPAGVPFIVQATTPVNCSVQVTATLVNSDLAAPLTSSVSAAIVSYFAGLGYAQPALQTEITAAVANVLAGYATGLAVTLLNSSSTPVTSVTATSVQRVILTSDTITL